MAYLAHDVKGSNLTRTSENKVKTTRNLDEHDKKGGIAPETIVV